ncbi:MAG TPA: metalloregulator ArsR/SmtB family transcription factor [Nitrospiria bacterium]|nr:metalloregulator ArsR/SmtB family transcription factor [Nitrospiria bacterium]
MTKPGRLIYEMQAEICRSLAHPVRLQILDILFEGERNSRDLQEVLDIPKANLSQHLSVLKEAGLIETRREGLFQYLSVSIPQIQEACLLVKKVLGEKLAGEERKNLEAQRELTPPDRLKEEKR